jgi:hypothetical protein
MDNSEFLDDSVRDPLQIHDRNTLAAQIAEFVCSNQSVSVVGRADGGRASLLLDQMRDEVQAALELRCNHVFVYIDCKVLIGAQHEAIFKYLIEKILAAEQTDLSRAGLSVSRFAAAQSGFALETVIRTLNQRGLRLVIAFDSFEDLSGNPNVDVGFFNMLRSLTGRYQLAYITASARPLIELTYADYSDDMLSSPFFNIFAIVMLGSTR